MNVIDCSYVDSVCNETVEICTHFWRYAHRAGCVGSRVMGRGEVGAADAGARWVLLMMLEGRRKNGLRCW